MADDKRCKVCGEIKRLSEFYFRKDTMKHKEKCKRCCIEGKNLDRGKSTKQCKHCAEEKPLSEFQKAGGGKWRQPYCKPCDSERKKKHRLDSLEESKLGGREYYMANRNRILNKDKQERLAKRPETLKRIREFINAKKMPPEERKKRNRECGERYRQKNKEALRAKKKEYSQTPQAKAKAREWQQRQKSDINFVTKKRLRGRIYVALKRGVKSQATMDLLGCSIEHFKKHFQSLFTEGMNWDAYMNERIHIDHIVPCKEFDLTDAEQQKKCFHYTNLQPLWEIDNLRKGATYKQYESCQSQ